MSLAPTLFPTLTAAAFPIDKGIIKKSPPIVIAMPLAAITSLPNRPRMIPAPLNMLSSMKFPNPTGIPPLSISPRIFIFGRSNREKSSVPKPDLNLR